MHYCVCEGGMIPVAHILNGEEEGDSQHSEVDSDDFAGEESG